MSITTLDSTYYICSNAYRSSGNLRVQHLARILTTHEEFLPWVTSTFQDVPTCTGICMQE